MGTDPVQGSGERSFEEFHGGPGLSEDRRGRPLSELLIGKAAVITGASGGLGRAVARLFAEAGANLFLVARSGDKLEAVRQELRSGGAEVTIFPADISGGRVHSEIRRFAIEDFNRIDILVNCAATLGISEDDNLSRTLAVNAFGPGRLAELLITDMMMFGSGKVINVNSGAARRRGEFPGLEDYAESKFALLGITDSLARTVSGTGVDVFSFEPGIMDTGMQQSLRSQPEDTFPLASIFAGFAEDKQLRPASESARAVLWAASDFSDGGFDRTEEMGQRAEMLSVDDHQLRARIAEDFNEQILPGRERSFS